MIVNARSRVSTWLETAGTGDNDSWDAGSHASSDRLSKAHDPFAFDHDHRVIAVPPSYSRTAFGDEDDDFTDSMGRQIRSSREYVATQILGGSVRRVVLRDDPSPSHSRGSHAGSPQHSMPRRSLLVGERDDSFAVENIPARR